MSTIADTTFKTKNTNLCVSIVTLLTKDNVKLTKILKEGLKRPAYWNEYKTKAKNKKIR